MLGDPEGQSCSADGKTIGELTLDCCTGGGRVGSGTYGLLVLPDGICAFLEGGRVGGCIFGLLLSPDAISGWFLSPGFSLVCSGLYCTLVDFEIFGIYGTCVVVDGTLAWFGLVGTLNLGGKGVGGAVMGSR